MRATITTINGDPVFLRVFAGGMVSTAAAAVMEFRVGARVVAAWLVAGSGLSPPCSLWAACAGRCCSPDAGRGRPVAGSGMSPS